jgi:hypothetical protein
VDQWVDSTDVLRQAARTRAATAWTAPADES